METIGEILQDYMKTIFIESVNHMGGDDWVWPEHWSVQRKLNFLEHSLNYAKDNEFWEQAVIIRDVTKKVEHESEQEDGQVHRDSE